MFQLRIEGVVGAKLLLDVHWPTRAVSLLAPKVQGWEPRGPHHRILRFEDVDDIRPNEIGPSIDHILEVLEFTKDLTDQDKLLVNCHMGVRRSTAMAMAVLLQHGMSPKNAYQHVKEVRPVANPNRLMTKLIDGHFGLNGRLLKAVGIT